MDRLWNSSRKVVGVDISDNAIIFAELVPSDTGYVLRRHGEVSLPAGVIEKSVVVDAERLAEALRTLARQHRITSARASIGHEGSHTIRLRIPLVPESEIRPVLTRVLAEKVATPAEDLVFDYRIIGQGIDYLELAVSFSVRHIVQGHTDAFAKAGIKLLSLAPKSRALIGALGVADAPNATLIVDISHTHTTATVVVEGIVASVSLLDFSSQHLDASIANALEISEDEARVLKHTYGMHRTEENETLFAVLYPHVLRLKEAIRSCFLQWHTSTTAAGSPEVTIDTVILTGTDASLPALAEYIAASLSVSVVVGDPWKHAQLPSNEVPPIPRAHAPRYTTALGLSLLGDTFGTLLPEAQRRYFSRLRTIRIAIFALLWLSVFSLVIFIFSVSI